MAFDFRDSYPLVQWDLNNNTIRKQKLIGSVDDSGNGYKLQILHDGNLLSPTTEKVFFYFEKHDNTHGYIEATIIDNLYVIDLTNQVFAVTGDVSCNFQIQINPKWKTSPEFKIKVDKNNISDSIESSDDFIVFQNALNDLIDITTDATTATTNAINATNSITTLESTVEANETIRIQHDSTRPIYHYKTQAQYDALPQSDKDNPQNEYEITDNNDSTIIDELTNLINATNTAKANADAVVVAKTGINDSSITTTEGWSSYKIDSDFVKADGTKAISTITIGDRKSGSPVGNKSCSQGTNNNVSGNCAFGSGINSTATGQASVSMGTNNAASGNYSVASGDSTVASGGNSFTGGHGTKASGENQAVFGQFNVEDTTSLFILGNGTDDINRSNAVKVDNVGNATFSGNISAKNSSFVLTGTVVDAPASTIPTGYLAANGQAVSRTIYTDLFAVIGTNNGVGDGSTTFNLPDWRGRGSMGYDVNQSEFNAVGKTGGEKSHVLTIGEMPQHNHEQYVTANPGTGGIGVRGSFNGVEGAGQTAYVQGVGTGFIGNNQSHNNLHPYITALKIIKY